EPCMAIKFVCGCGKRLRARDDMAARRTVCPRCGAPVGIPSPQSAARGTALGPMTPAERVHARLVARPNGLQSSVAPPAGSPAEGFVPPPLYTPDTTQDTYLQDPSSALANGFIRLDKRGSGVVRRKRWAPLTSRHPRAVETRGYQCLLHPLRAWSLVLGLAV